MALSYYEICKIKNIIDHDLEAIKPCKVLCLGYPDILVTKEQFLELFSVEDFNKIQTREDNIDVAVTHKVKELIEWACESYSLFEVMGAELIITDFTSWTGKEKVLDLNYPVQEQEYNQFDIIIDPGTTEHIFNIAQAMQNILYMAKVGGFIYHQTPYNFPNHGFYSFSPTFYIDFYEDNGAKLLSCNTMQSDCKTEETPLELREPFELPLGANSVFIKKIKEQTIKYPVQGKYKNSFNNQVELDACKEFFSNDSTLALVPYNNHSKFYKNFFADKQVTIFDDNYLLQKHFGIKPIATIVDMQFDKILITSLTFEKKIRAKLLAMGISNEKIFLQV